MNRQVYVCTDGLVGNLRLWSVQEFVSSVLFITAKAYTAKQ
jgi:hypothetical protein